MSTGGKHEGAEVSLRLVVDSNAKEETEKVRKGLLGLWDSAKKGMKHVDVGMASNAKAIGGLLLSTEALVAGAALGGIAAVGGLAAASAHAFMESEEQVRGLAGTLTMIDQNGNAFQDLYEYAEDLKDGLEDVAMQAGVTDDAMVEVFDNIIERGGKSVDAAMKLTEQMAYAGRAIKGGPEALSQGFEMLQMGMVRAKNPIVQLISSTQTLKGSAKSVAKEMQKLSIDKQMELAEAAIAKMGDKMKSAPMTIAQMRTAMGVGIGNLFEEAGKPIVNALTPIVAKVQSLFMGSRGGLLQAAEKFGGLMAQGLSLVVPVMEAVEQAVRQNWGEISAAINEVYGSAKGVFDYLYKNRKAIAQTFVDVATVLIKAGAYIMKAVSFVADKIGGYLKWQTKVGMFGEGAKGLLVDQTRESSTESLRGKVLEGSRATGMDDGYKKELHDKFIAEMVDAGAKVSDAEDMFASAYKRASDDHMATFTKISKYREAAIYADSGSFANAWKIATEANDEGAKEYVANFLAQNHELVKQIGEKGPEILGDGFATLIEKLEGMHSTIADELKKGSRPKLGVDSKISLNQNFSGPITVKQDFRDQDPDRVAEVFKKDMGRYGTNRLQSKFAGPLGQF